MCDEQENKQLLLHNKASCAHNGFAAAVRSAQLKETQP